MSHGHTSNPKDRHRRLSVRNTPCPKCGAALGQKCIGVRVKERAASHIERWQAWRGYPVEEKVTEEPARQQELAL